MKNTALAELIHYIEHKGELHKETLLNKAKSLLEKENEDLSDAKQEGYADGYQDATNDILSSI